MFTSENAAEYGAKGKRGPSRLRSLIIDSVDSDEALSIFRKLRDKAAEGDMDAIKTYLAYVVGKPKESLEISGPNGSVLTFNIIPDQGCQPIGAEV